MYQTDPIEPGKSAKYSLRARQLPTAIVGRTLFSLFYAGLYFRPGKAKRYDRSAVPLHLPYLTDTRLRL